MTLFNVTIVHQSNTFKEISSRTSAGPSDKFDTNWSKLKFNQTVLLYLIADLHMVEQFSSVYKYVKWFSLNK